MDFIQINNDEQKIIGTNYFETPNAQKGYAYVSINAAAIRLLAPDQVIEMLPKLKSIWRVVVEFGGPHIRILFYDNEPDPFYLDIDHRQSDRRPAQEDAGRTIPFFIYNKDLELLRETTCEVRID